MRDAALSLHTRVEGGGEWCKWCAGWGEWEEWGSGGVEEWEVGGCSAPGGFICILFSVGQESEKKTAKKQKMTMLRPRVKNTR